MDCKKEITLSECLPLVDKALDVYFSSNTDTFEEMVSTKSAFNRIWSYIKNSREGELNGYWRIYHMLPM